MYLVIRFYLSLSLIMEAYNAVIILGEYYE